MKHLKINIKHLIVFLSVVVLIGSYLFTTRQTIVFMDKKLDPITSFSIEIANTDESRKTGLMHRENLAEKSGMLFIFAREQIAAMWMKNTKIPLDMIFINKDNVVKCIRKNTTPESLIPIVCPFPVSYVLEINGGMSDKFNLKPGNIVKIKY